MVGPTIGVSAARKKGGADCIELRDLLFSRPSKSPEGQAERPNLVQCGSPGAFFEQGNKFSIRDDWTNPDCSHRILNKKWVGKTYFDVDPEEDLGLGGDYRRQRDRAQPNPASTPQPKTATARVSWADMDSD